MNSIERRRPVTRRKRLTVLGVGGVIAVAASVPAWRSEAPDRLIVPPTALPPNNVATVPSTVSVAFALGALERRRPETSRSHVRVPVTQWDAAQVWAEGSWATAVRWCESRNNPQAVSASGEYGGLYQADQTFWDAYREPGFASSPETASRGEQNLVAYRGWLVRGSEPWPICKDAASR